MDHYYAEYNKVQDKAFSLRSQIDKLSVPLDVYGVLNMFDEYVVEKGGTRPKDDTLLSFFDLNYPLRREDDQERKERAETIELLRLVLECLKASMLETFYMQKLTELGCRFRVVWGRLELEYIPRE